jgi:hypothetical protein
LALSNAFKEKVFLNTVGNVIKFWDTAENKINN